jgi:excisionase family DNA binding protein
MTYAEVAAELHVKRGTLWFWVSRGLIPHVRLGPRTVRFRREDLRRWLEQHAIRASSGP